jgi:hypothetical protein
MQELITIIKLIGELVEKLGPMLTMLVLFGVVWFKYLRHGSVIVLGSGDKTRTKDQNGQGSQNGNGATKGTIAIFNKDLCDAREKHCLDRFSYQKEKIEDHEERLKKGDENFKLMHGDIKVLLDRTQHLDQGVRQ